MNTLQKCIEDRQKELKSIELLIAAGKGEVDSVKRLIEESADINFVDNNGNTALHYAVGSEDLEVVQLLINHVKDTDTENNENQAPLDIASGFQNEGFPIISALGEKVMNKSLRLLQEDVTDAEVDDTPSIQKNVALTQAEQEIRNTEDKIKYCLEAIDKLKESEYDKKNLSYEQANVLIYFCEAFALDGSSDEEVKSKLKKYFSQHYSENDRKQISDARSLLFKKSDKIIGLQDVGKFIEGDISSFFQKLKQYVQCVNDKLILRENNNEIELSSFFNDLKKEDRNLGEKIDDARAFLKAEFEKIVAAAYGKHKITSEELFGFTMNFYPALKKETNDGFTEVRDMRNKLIHQFHKYGNVEFGNAIYSLRSRLFKYYYAQEVLKIINAIEPAENPEKIGRNLKRKLANFNEQFKSGYGSEQVISQEDAKGSLGYVFSHSVFPERDDIGIEDLVDQYLKFMIIIDSERKDQYDLIGIESDQEDAFGSSETDHEEKTQHQQTELSDVERGGEIFQDTFDSNETDREGTPHHQQTELSDIERREMFEKFCRLKRIKNYCSKGYNEEKQKLRDELTKIYRVNGNHFDIVCSSYVEQSSEFSQKDKIKVKEIAKTMNNIIKLKGKYKLSNQIIISLCGNLFGKKGFSFSEENYQNLLRGMDQRTQQEIKNELPRNKLLGISIGTETFFIRIGNIISNMLKTFYNAYHKYQVEFNVEEIFNDDIFLDYIARTEIKEKDIADVVDSHFQLLAFICSRKQKQEHKLENQDDFDVKEIFGIFKTLQTYREHSCEQNYKNKKEMLRKKFADETFWLSEIDFDKLCELFIENDCERQEKEFKEAERVKSIIVKLKALRLSWCDLTWLYEKLIGKGNLNSEEDMSLLRNMDKSQKENVKKKLQKLYAEDLAETKINIEFGKETFDLPTKTFILIIIKTFKEERDFEKPFFIHTIIKKLLNVGYCAPYVVKLITKVNSDDIIERDDLLKLIDILLKKEEGLYIKHLHALLNIGSGKLDLHEEVCNKIVEHDVNIGNMRIILKEPNHLKKFLNILKSKINVQHNSKKMKFVEVIREILKVLSNVSYEMCRRLSYDLALEILDEANSAQEHLILLNFIHKTDLNVLKTQYQIGRIKNRIGMGMQEQEHSNRTQIHVEALTVFRRIHEKLRYKEGSREEREIKVHEMPAFLLVLNEMAHTKQLLKKYLESCTEHENLCKEVVKFVLDLSKKNQLLENFLNAEMYKEIKKSKRYHKLLNFSEESKKHLDILNIRLAVAYNKTTQAHTKALDEKFREAREHYSDALLIYKEVYEFRKNSSGLVIPALIHISFVFNQLACLCLKMGEIHNALKYNYLALQSENKVYAGQKNMFWPNHFAVLKSRKKIVNLLGSIAFALGKFSLTVSKEEGQKWSEKSLETYEKIYDISYKLYGKKHYLTTNAMNSIGFTLCCLGRRVEAQTKLQKLYDIQIEELGESDTKTLKTRNLLDKIAVQLGFTSGRRRNYSVPNSAGHTDAVKRWISQHELKL